MKLIKVTATKDTKEQKKKDSAAGDFLMSKIRNVERSRAATQQTVEELLIALKMVSNGAKGDLPDNERRNIVAFAERVIKDLGTVGNSVSQAISRFDK